jgi:hypothetical protein
VKGGYISAVYPIKNVIDASVIGSGSRGARNSSYLNLDMG